jgi:lipopolysaccharide export system permease protein
MLIARYFFRQTSSALLMILISLTLIVWLTSVLREIKLLTSEGQTFWLFMKITGLTIPNLIVMVAPVAYLIACLHTLNRLNGDSELIVLSASGASVWRIFAPYFVLGTIVAMAILAANFFILPPAARLLQDYISQVRADLLSQVLQPGEFSELEQGLTINVRDKADNGDLLGVVLHDERDRRTINTIVAEKGVVSSVDGRAQMDLYDGQILREREGRESIEFVNFKTYSFDMSDFAAKSGTRELRPQEVGVSELLFPDKESSFYKNNEAGIRSELHQRLSTPLFPFVYALLAVLYLGRPRTTREGRGGLLFTAFLMGAILRASGIAGVNIVGKKMWALGLLYGLPVFLIVLFIAMLQFNVPAPVFSIPKLKLALPARFGRKPALGAAQ